MSGAGGYDFGLIETRVVFELFSMLYKELRNLRLIETRVVFEWKLLAQYDDIAKWLIETRVVFECWNDKKKASKLPRLIETRVVFEYNSW